MPACLFTRVSVCQYSEEQSKGKSRILILLPTPLLAKELHLKELHGFTDLTRFWVKHPMCWDSEFSGSTSLFGLFVEWAEKILIEHYV